MSGLRTMKRSWSGSVHDMEGDGVSVIGTKAQMTTKHASSSSSLKALANSTNRPADYDYDQEFDDVSYNFTLTPKHTLSAGFKGSQSNSNVKSSQIAMPENGATASSSQSRPLKADRASEEQMPGMKKRQLPASFLPSNSSLNDDKYQRTAWSKSAAELRSTGERLTFLVDGKSGTAKNEEGAAGPSRMTVHQQQDKGVAKIFLSKEQQVVFERVVNNGKSMFFTGSAGTGKSVALREIIKGLRRKFAGKADAVAVTASTGIAACNIGGTTLHAFAGAGLCVDPVDKLVSKVKKNRKSASRWMRTHVLIIDEVSMISPDFLDKLEEMARILRRTPKPFGGMQIVMTGDFFQLPPVERGSQRTRYAFDAKCWHDIAQDKINLTQVFRQKDPKFVNMLNELRFGKLSSETTRLFSSLTQESEMQKTSKMAPTILFPMRREVEQANAMQLVKIKRPAHSYDATDEGTLLGDQRTRMLDNFMAPSKLHLKLGCQVMLIKNTDEQLVNGSIGRVVGFLTQAEFQEAMYCNFDWDFVDPEEMTEEEIRTSIKESFAAQRRDEAGQTVSELNERNFHRANDGRSSIVGEGGAGPIKSRAELAEAIRKEERRERSRSRSASPERREAPRMPVVRFLIQNPSANGGRRFRTSLVTREVWKNEQPNGEVLVSRTQVPLILAWAMSIHKSQGQTLPLVKIDLNKTFEKGQAYVALSRAVSQEGLQVLGFHPSKVRVDDRVVEWYKSLPTVS